MTDEMEMRFRPAGAVKALTNRRLAVLACPHGSPQDLDHLNEWFSARTDFMTEPGDRRPTLYFHGFTPDKKMTAQPKPIGVATATRRDDDGLWMEVDLKPSGLADRVWEAAERGTCRASTGAVNYLCRSSREGEVLVWPIGELSLIDEGLGRHPVNDKAVAIPLRASFDLLDLRVPEAFEQNAAASPEEPAILTGEKNMEKIEEPKVETPAPPPAPAKAEIAEEPKYRAKFNIAKETVGEPADNAKKESWEWFWHLRHGKMVGPSMRVLEEHVAAEGLPMVPQDALDAIIAQRNELSIVSRIGAIRYQTDKQIFNIPREVTAMTALALIAEEGAYVANEPAFGLLAITTLKYGSLIAATEELLEDQNLFIPWFTKACGRAWALAENAQFYTTCDVAANGTVYGAASDTLTLAEWNTWFWGLTAPYRDGSVIIMNQGTMAVLAGLLVATPYAFGGYPIMRLNAAGIVDIGGFPMYTVADWLLYSAAAALGLVLSMINPQFCGIVERRGMTIKVDPYSTAGTGIINYYPSVRFAPFVTQALAHSVKNGA